MDPLLPPPSTTPPLLDPPPPPPPIITPPPPAAPPVSNNSTVPPPTYTATQPQILVAPLPDAASFFWGRTVQGEVYVKGLGEGRGPSHGVKSLTIQLVCLDVFPDQPDTPLYDFAIQHLFPTPSSPLAESTSSPPPIVDLPFSTSNRFSVPLPDGPLPGTLNLTPYGRGEVRYALIVRLVLSSGVQLTEEVRVEGTPQDPPPPVSVEEPDPVEVESVLDIRGARVRMLLDTAEPRLGSLLRLGVEIRAKERQKTAVAGLAQQADPASTLRPLRRVRVELFRRVLLPAHEPTPSSSTTPPSNDGRQHLTLLYTSGKSLRYPGNSPALPPLRVLFTIPTTTALGATWGEITQTTPYHHVTFFVRVSLGFGASMDVSTSVEGGDWVLEREISIRPKVWKEPREVVIERGQLPVLGDGADMEGIPDEEVARIAYRVKGRDVVGQTGTVRPGSMVGEDLPPPFEGEGEAGPSTAGELPSFLESEAQARTGDAPLLAEVVRSERLVPVGFEGEDEQDRSTWVGRRESLGGELGTWIEYDGYETFSVAPPSVSASFGVGGSMDPPQEGDEDVGVINGMMAARLGLGEGGRGVGGMELMEQLGLGEGTRIVDLQDDLPPTIDEPSFPALPGFSTQPAHGHFRARPPDASPPSFALSEAQAAAAAAAGQPPVHPIEGEAPPGYFGASERGRDSGPGDGGGGGRATTTTTTAGIAVDVGVGGGVGGGRGGGIGIGRGGGRGGGGATITPTLGDGVGGGPPAYS
ncbi:hypothetical protein BCR39DRAFT_586062 [Naematelia encephala]|uniref:Uncharacterized protein n=1 Tax=Naematelia encephala TaxID=71784 RepID=A0A1Y2BHJ1_9TREE|nr:hypothetical protein BCR39DRAFT_586062 [Naematelia encephala]